MRPEEALEQARAEAARKRSEGVYPPEEPALAAPTPAMNIERLREWAIVEVDPDLVYSTRRGGRPITWFKKLVLRMMRQYTTELEAQQTRFNVGVVAYLESLERRDDD